MRDGTDNDDTGAVTDTDTNTDTNTDSNTDSNMDTSDTGAPGTLDLGSADARYTGEGAGDWAGISVSTAGDVNADGYDDILVGASAVHDKEPDPGAAYLVLGGPSPADLDLGSADARYAAESEDDYAGCSVSTAGDVDGDGYDDVLVGAPRNEEGGAWSGAIYLVLGSASPGDLELRSADAKFSGEASYDSVGRAVSRAGDVDGDGHDDVLAGAYNNDANGADAGSAYLVLAKGMIATGGRGW